MTFAYALKNAVVMILILCISHLLMLNALHGHGAALLEPVESARTSAPAGDMCATASQEEEELLRYVMEDDVPFTIGARATPLDIAGAACVQEAVSCKSIMPVKQFKPVKQVEDVQPYAMSGSFGAQFSAVDFIT
jgi:hypothetical protein